MADEPFCVAVDWGTSMCRAWLLAGDGAVLAETRNAMGMLKARDYGFERALDDQRQALDANPSLPVIICGMAGARQGWIEAAYASTPAALHDLPANAVRVPTAGDVRILPGVAQRDPRADVMRGEETQLLGIIDADDTALICMPGTHSKWVDVSNGRIERFNTFMTGELFDVLSRHTILQHSTNPEQAFDATCPVFERAITLTIDDNTPLSASLFSIRANSLLNDAGIADGTAFLSGLLIANEVMAARQTGTAPLKVQLMASGRIAELYQTVLERAGFEVARIDAEQASRNGLIRAARSIWGDS